MNNYKNILLAIEFSEHDEAITKKAKDLAEQLKAQLHIIHVLDNIPMPDTPYGTVISLDESTHDALLEAEKSKLRHIGNHLGIAPSQCWMVWGNPQEEIIQLAVKLQIDLIVVGSHSRHGLAVLMGSTAKDILYHAQCDVLAIHLKST
ncbi:universal stress protein A [Nitrosomonas sp. PY1]|uniref:universal stress protein n=1 Tax=Nitrosomonas sp. PY1 TaxID=1803906 RepID=UPI001FC8399B|nr:universal stress protein [Nitrosomonas sp. PY1]GKS68713.1 universal stress protein A [Nitrosomonas sp. PY1]